jgi:hypothetical protein
MSESSDPNGNALEQLIARFLRTVPEKWAEYDLAALSEIEELAIRLLTAAGMIERRMTIRLRLFGHPEVAEATITFTGEGGLAQAAESLLADLWDDWREIFEKRKASDLKDAPTSHCERIGKEQWRLTIDGASARNELGGDEIASTRMLDFVLKRGFFDGKPRLLPGGRISQRLPVNGRGALERMLRVGSATPRAGFDITNCPEVGEAVAKALAEQTKADQQPLPAQPTPPPKLDVEAWVDELRKQGHANPAALVAYMADKTKATVQDVGQHVHGDKDASDDAVRKNVARTNDLLTPLGSKLSFQFTRGHVYRYISPK